MKYSADEYNVLSYLLKKNSISYEKAIEWAYSQYTNENADPFVEKVSLASDVSEILEMISDKFQVHGKPDQEFLAGEVASRYSNEQISLYDALARILFDLDLELPEEERQELYIAEDYFGWHSQAEEVAIKHVLPIFSRCRHIYEHAVAKFSV